MGKANTPTGGFSTRAIHFGYNPADHQGALVPPIYTSATTDITDLVAERLGGHVPVTLIPDAGHHIMLDQPIALIAVLQTLLGQWRHT